MNTLLRALKVYIDGKISKSVKPQVNSDWDETDSNSASFIRNKPFGSSSTTVVINEEELSINKYAYIEEDGFLIDMMYAVINFEERLTDKLGTEFRNIVFENHANLSGDFFVYGENGLVNGVADLNNSFNQEDIYTLFGEESPCVAYVFELFLVFIFDNKAIVSLVGVGSNSNASLNISFTTQAEGVKALDNKYVSIPDDFEINNSISIQRGKYSYIGRYSMSIGEESFAEGDSSVALGTGCGSGGQGSVATGCDTRAHALGSLATGCDTFVGNGGTGSMASGIGTICRMPGVNVHGSYNAYDLMRSGWVSYSRYQIDSVIVLDGIQYRCIKAHTASYSNMPPNAQYWEVYRDYDIHVVGNGTSEFNRSNAYTLTMNGDAWFSGDVYVHSNSGTNKDEGSKKLMTEDDLAGIVLLPEVTASDNGKVMMVSNGQWTVGNTADITPVPYAEGVKF